MKTYQLNIYDEFNHLSRNLMNIFSSQASKKSRKDIDNQRLEEIYERENAEAMEELIKRYGSQAEVDKVLDEISTEMDDFIDKMLKGK